MQLKESVVHPITFRPTLLEINLSALQHNFKVLSSHAAPAKVMPILKANAYGHGLVECAIALAKAGAEILGVAFVEEGIELRQAGIKIPILVLGGIFGSQIKHFLDFDLDLTASSVSKLEAIDELAKSLNKRARVHLKIDTGMNRLGVQYYSAETLFEASLRCKNCDVVSVFSHFASSSDENPQFTYTQLERFNECLRFYEKRSLPFPIRHIANSGAVLREPKTFFEWVRPGIALYGVMPSPFVKNSLGLKPVMSLKSHIVFVKTLRKGATVSYSQTWTASKDSRVVTIPIGYGDGFNRCLSNKGHVLIRAKRYPIVGRVCMDQIMVNVDKDEAYNADEVVLIGKQGSEEISVSDIATWAGISTHEVLVDLNLRIPRRFVEK